MERLNSVEASGVDDGHRWSSSNSSSLDWSGVECWWKGELRRWLFNWLFIWNDDPICLIVDKSRQARHNLRGNNHRRPTTSTAFTRLCSAPGFPLFWLPHHPSHLWHWNRHVVHSPPTKRFFVVFHPCTWLDYAQMAQVIYQNRLRLPPPNFGWVAAELMRPSIIYRSPEHHHRCLTQASHSAFWRAVAPLSLHFLKTNKKFQSNAGGFTSNNAPTFQLRG